MDDSPSGAQMDATSAAVAMLPPQGGTAIHKLPIEVHMMIMKSCEYTALHAFRRTDKYFYNLAEVNKTRILLDKESSKWPAVKYFPCYSCYQFLPWTEFAGGEKIGTKFRGGNAANTRICMLCALKKRICQPGDKVVYRRDDHYVCMDCEKLCGIYETPRLSITLFRFSGDG